MNAAWIKIETTTPDKPEVAAMAARLKKDPDLVVGKLVRLWAWADLHSVAGEALPITRAWLDRLVHVRGMAAALEAVGWLEGEDGAIRFPRFDRHNGRTAKSRAQEARKKAGQRDKGPETQGTDGPPESGTNVPPPPGQKRDTRGGLEEEEEKEEGECAGAGARALAIVEQYPRREAVEEAAGIVARHLAQGESFEAMHAGTKAIAAVIRELPSGHLNRYVPSARQFFAGKRWKDDPATFRRQAEAKVHANGRAPMTREEALAELGGRVDPDLLNLETSRP